METAAGTRSPSRQAAEEPSSLTGHRGRRDGRSGWMCFHAAAARLMWLTVSQMAETRK
jgi:hypothetical protein